MTQITDCCLTPGTEYELDCFNSQADGGWGAGFISVEGTALCDTFTLYPPAPPPPQNGQNGGNMFGPPPRDVRRPER
eukprot:COSAG01_NODE_1192_length_11309_cov_8.575609_7_plen_77_part_00